jgi:hypothetical protein
MLGILGLGAIFVQLNEIRVVKNIANICCNRDELILNLLTIVAR